MKRFVPSQVVLASLLLVFSCTDFIEEELPVAFSTDATEWSFSKDAGIRTMVLRSSARWELLQNPEWMNLESVASSKSSPFEWILTFSIETNDNYNREGQIRFQSQNEYIIVPVLQEGRRGVYVPVESVLLSSTTLTMTEGDSQSLTAIITPTLASDKTVTWTSSNPSVVSVSYLGVLNAQSVGTATITVKTNDLGKTATCNVTVKAKVVPVTGVVLDNNTISLTEGESLALTAIVTPSNATDQSVTWSSSNTSVATVSSLGVVTAKAVGSATITVKTNDGSKTATCAVTVNPVSVIGVSLNKAFLTLTIGGTEKLTPTIIPSNATNKNVSWSSSDKSVARVDSNGSVSAIKVGTSVIIATTEDGGKTATCILTVDPVSVTGVNLNKSSLTLLVGDSETLTATVAPSNATNKRVSWSSSNTSVVTVDSNGKVNAVSGGTASIAAMTEDGGKTASCSVTVYVPDGSENGYEYVVLGLPSGLKWATCNVGAYKPEEYGNFYAWGETQSKTDYSGGTYKWWNWNGVTYKLTKYCPADQTSCWNGEGTPDGKTVLDLEDDTAHVNLGGHWRMPTDEEWVELMENCTWTWTIQNGIAGRLVSANNGKSIFLPAAGLQDHRDLINVGSYGLYWSSSLATDDPDQAWFMYFGSDIVYWDRMSRYYGYSIRPVLD